jgi:hypothetical protein
VHCTAFQAGCANITTGDFPGETRTRTATGPVDIMEFIQEQGEASANTLYITNGYGVAPLDRKTSLDKISTKDLRGAKVRKRHVFVE